MTGPVEIGVLSGDKLVLDSKALRQIAEEAQDGKERIQRKVAAQRLACTLAAGLERESFPAWWPFWLCLAAEVQCQKGCKSPSGVVPFRKGAIYRVEGVRFPPLEKGEAAYACVVLADTLDSSHRVTVYVRKIDLPEEHALNNASGPTLFAGRCGLGLNHKARFNLHRPSMYAMPHRFEVAHPWDQHIVLLYQDEQARTGRPCTVARLYELCRERKLCTEPVGKVLPWMRHQRVSPVRVNLPGATP